MHAQVKELEEMPETREMLRRCASPGALVVLVAPFVPPTGEDGATDDGVRLLGSGKDVHNLFAAMAGVVDCHGLNCSVLRLKGRDQRCQWLLEALRPGRGGCPVGSL